MTNWMKRVPKDKVLPYPRHGDVFYTYTGSKVTVIGVHGSIVKTYCHRDKVERDWEMWPTRLTMYNNLWRYK